MHNLSWRKTFPNRWDVIPNEPGLYVISVLLLNGNFKAIYVGQSTDMQKRIKEHFSETETNVQLKKYLSNNFSFKISYATVETTYLDSLEKYLINYYSPEFNVQDGNGIYIHRCNLPNVTR